MKPEDLVNNLLSEDLTPEQQRVLKHFPEIGVLNRGGKPVFYATIRGQHVEHPDIEVIAGKIGG